MTILAVLIAIVAGVAVGWWVKHEQTASAEAIPNAARIQNVEGEVALSNTTANADQANANWVAAAANQPFTVGDRIYTKDNSRASLAFTGRNFARLNPNTSLDVLTLSEDRTQLALRDGSAMFDVGYLPSGSMFEVATPYGAVDLQQPGLYDIGFDNGNVVVSVLSGLAQVVGLGGSGQISKGEMLRLLGQTAADVVLSRIDGRNAGYLVDDYYRYQYPRYYDGRYRDYNTYLEDPYYFDPYRRTTSYQYVNSYIPGIYDLDYYGNWQNLDGYGYAWAPRVDSYWAPYQEGYWVNDYPYGPTWVSSEPWGYAPYHYGRWAFVGNQWYWVPGNASAYPTYSPALVAYVPFGQNDIGWVALGPNDPYAPRYYYNDWQPYYLNGTPAIQSQLANLYVPNAVTVVGINDFAQGYDWRRARRADRQMLASVNPILDPLTVTPLRNAVIHSAWGRGKIDIPPGIARKLQDTTVVTSVTPVSPRFRQDLARTMRVESVNGRSANREFKVRDERGGGNGSPSQAQRNEPSAAPVQDQTGRDRNGPGSVRQEQRGAGNAQRAVQAERPGRPAQQQQPQGERVSQPAQQRPTRGPVRSNAPSVRREPGNVRVERPARQAPSQPVRQSAPRAAERPQNPGRGQARPQPQQPVRQAPVQQQAPRAAERPQNPGRGQGRPQQAQPAAAKAQPRGQGQAQQQPKTVQPKGGGPGKGKKP